MVFNNYLWGLYKQTDVYKNHVEFVRKAKSIDSFINTLEFDKEEK